MSDSDDSTRHVTRRCNPTMRVSTVQNLEDRKLNLKVPPFSPEDPEIWFALLEGQFYNFGITDDQAKFNQVIINLDMTHAKAVKDLIVNPPLENRYEKIKAELIRRLSASHELKVKQLLTHEELGDRKPSQFLRHLKDLAGPSIPDDFIKSIWSSRLPQNLQTIMASQPYLSLDQLADLADRVQEVTSPASYHVAAASSSGRPAPGDSVQNEISALRKMVERLELKLDQQSRNPHRGHHHRSRQHGRSPTRTRSRSNSSYRKYPLCFFHRRYGADARKCLKPCDFGKAGNSTGGR